MLRAARHLRRLVAIFRTLARHDALFVFDAIPAVADIVRLIGRLPGFTPRADIEGLRRGQRLAAACEALGPGFVKFGQGLSTRSDILGAEMAADLTTLQDRLPPFSGARARDVIEAELGAPVDELFDAFEDEATAAASIAQVHFAILVGDDGEAEEVAVKILRPGIEAAFARDVDLLAWLAEIAERRVPKLRRFRPVASVATFAETVRREMDLRMEAAAAEELRHNFADSDIYRVPKIDWRLTSRRVMTAERIEGTPIHDAEALVAQGLVPEEIVERASQVFFAQVFEHGFFHADMHPGNLFVAADGSLIAVDFGIMGRIDKKARNYFADMLVGFLTGDYETVAKVHFRAGLVPPDTDHGAFVQALRSIGDPILERPTHEISIARLLGQLFHVTEQFDMQAQPQLLLLQKTMLLAEGVGRELAPQVNMWLLARPLIEAWMEKNRGPDARVLDWLEEAADTLALIPVVLRRLADEPPREARSARVWPYWLAIGLLAAALLAR